MVISERVAGEQCRSGALAVYPKNALGRDFVVGDLHGMFPHLRALLEEIDFKGGRDRLFSVGDLVDRGPESRACYEWLAYPWFQAVRGNHEQFALDSADPEQLEIWLRYNGGEWWLDLTPAEQQKYRDVFARLPLAIEIETDSGTVGIVHADVPPLLTWDRFTDLLQRDDRDATFYALWSRNRLQNGSASARVGGRVERIYCGHTPTRHAALFGNVYFIDTGAVYVQEGYRDAKLTIVEIHPNRHVEFTIDTGREV